MTRNTIGDKTLSETMLAMFSETYLHHSALMSQHLACIIVKLNVFNLILFMVEEKDNISTLNCKKKINIKL